MHPAGWVGLKKNIYIEHGTTKVHNASLAARDSWTIEILEQFWGQVELNTWRRFCIYMYDMYGRHGTLVKGAFHGGDLQPMDL